MNWQEQLPGFVSGVLASLAAMAIGACLKRAYPPLKEWLSERVVASRLAISKITSSLGEISFLAEAKRKLTNFAQVVVVGACRLAIFCFWMFVIYYQVNRFTERANTVQAYSAATSGENSPPSTNVHT